MYLLAKTQMLLAQWNHNVSEWGIGQILIAVLLIAGAIAITYIVLNKLNMKPPDFVVSIFWVVIAVAVGILAIKFLLSL